MKLTCLLLIATCVNVFAQSEKKTQTDMSSCPMHAKHAEQSDEHFAGVVRRGEAHEGMGFSQTQTTHHFLLTPTGGIILVTANDPTDAESIVKIQQHLQHISQLFAKGDFSIPHFVHDQTPPGVKTMQKLKNRITYTNEKLDAGASLVISTDSPKALAAVHDFLRFQIVDHHIGDPQTAASAVKE
jgi:hypothetical protein